MAACGPAVETVAPTDKPADIAATATVAPTKPADIQMNVTPTTAPTATKVVEAAKYKEAPALAELVKQGKLPAVEKRLPPEPVIVPVEEAIGNYGGTMYIGTPDLPQGYFYRYWDYQPIWRWAPRWQGTMPGIAKSVDISTDSKTYTFHLRQGIKWSDGEELTSDDYMFYFEDIVLNDEYMPNKPNWLKAGGELAKISAPDEYTLVFQFSSANGIFLMDLATAGNAEVYTTPKHYLKQFHPKYNDKVMDLAAEKKFATWAELYDYHHEQANNSDIPNLGHFHMEWDLEKDNTQLAASRNPYYHKVDPEGNQLPYIDRCISFMIQDVEVLTLKTMNGEIDHVNDKYTLAANKPVYIDAAKKGNFRLFDVVPTYPNAFNIAFNLNCSDANLHEIFNNKDFRIGMSHAINRKELIEIIYPGVTEPHQTAPRPELRFYHEKLAKQYTEYSVDTANEFLDKTGWTKRDADGYRLGPDGKRISFIFELDEGRTAFVDTMNLVIKYWQKVGVECVLKTMVRALWEERVRGKTVDFHASGHFFGGGVGDYVLLDPRWYFPYSSGSSFFARSWADWYNGIKSDVVEEPPDDVKKQMDLFKQVKATGDPDKQKDLMTQVLDISADRFYTIGICYEPLQYGVATNRMQNVPDKIPLSWVYPSPGPDNMDQMWINEKA